MRAALHAVAQMATRCRVICVGGHSCQTSSYLGILAARALRAQHPRAQTPRRRKMEVGRQKKRGREGAGDFSPRGGKESARSVAVDHPPSRSASFETPAGHKGAVDVSDTDTDKYVKNGVVRLQEEARALRKRLAMMELERVGEALTIAQGELPTPCGVSTGPARVRAPPGRVTGCDLCPHRCARCRCGRCMGR